MSLQLWQSRFHHLDTRLAIHLGSNRNQLASQRHHRGCISVRAEPLKAQVQKTNEALKQANDIFLSKLESDAKAREEILESREEKLWRRQDSVWEGEHKRWQEERKRWDERESQLQAQISELQSRLLSISQSPNFQSSQQNPPQQNFQPQQQNSQQDRRPNLDQKEVNSNLAETGSGRISTEAGPSNPSAPEKLPQQNSKSEIRYPPTNSVVDAASQFMPPDGDDFKPPSREDFAPLQEGDPGVERVRDSLQAAFSAVHTSDVLTTDFSNLEQALSHRLEDTITVGTSQIGSNGSSSTNGSDSGRKPNFGKEGPPNLSKHDDDIFWMSQLHGALLQASLFPGEEDIETWSFGERTLDAVLTFQAVNGLPETGIVDDRTWEKLLGKDYKQIKPPQEPEGTPTAEEASFHLGLSSNDTQNPTAPSQSPELEEDPLDREIRNLRANSELANRRKNNFTERVTPSVTENFQDWPILREGDGNRNVHHLQVALERNGFNPDIEDQRWWQFGSSTLDCVYTFQACSGLAETGIVDGNTWMKLLGEESTPDMIALLTNEFEDDLADNQGAVWLVGEQRWSNPVKTAP